MKRRVFIETSPCRSMLGQWIPGTIHTILLHCLVVRVLSGICGIIWYVYPYFSRLDWYHASEYRWHRNNQRENRPLDSVGIKTKNIQMTLKPADICSFKKVKLYRPHLWRLRMSCRLQTTPKKLNWQTICIMSEKATEGRYFHVFFCQKGYNLDPNFSLISLTVSSYYLTISDT